MRFSLHINMLKTTLAFSFITHKICKKNMCVCVCIMEYQTGFPNAQMTRDKRIQLDDLDDNKFVVNKLPNISPNFVYFPCPFFSYTYLYLYYQKNILLGSCFCHSWFVNVIFLIHFAATCFSDLSIFEYTVDFEQEKKN